jgi:hypothetical protein
MKDDSCDEPVCGLVAKPGEMSGIVASDGGGSLHLDADESPATELEHDIHLVPAVPLPQVVHPGPRIGHAELASKLSHNERVNDPAK